MKGIQLIFFILLIFCSEKLFSQDLNRNDAVRGNRMDSDSSKYYPPTPPVYYKDVKEANTDISVQDRLARKQILFQSTGSSVNLPPPTAPVSFDKVNSKGEFNNTGLILQSERINKEQESQQIKRTAPVYQPRNSSNKH